MGTYVVLVNSTDKGAVNVREVPNRQQASRDTAAISINSKGNVRTTTMRAWDEAEHFEFLKNLP